jgi:hypothetical protein
LLIDMKNKRDEDHDGRGAGQHREDEQAAPAEPLPENGGPGCVPARAPRGPGRGLLFLEPLELSTTRGALIDVGFDRRQLGQADLALAKEEKALASFLACHGSNRLLSTGTVAFSTTV